MGSIISARGTVSDRPVARSVTVAEVEERELIFTGR